MYQCGFENFIFASNKNTRTQGNFYHFIIFPLTPPTQSLLPIFQFTTKINNRIRKQTIQKTRHILSYFRVHKQYKHLLDSIKRSKN